MRIPSATPLLLILGCSSTETPTPSPYADEMTEVEPGEWLPGGETTNTFLLGSQAFLFPAATLSEEHEAAFYSGNSFFNQAWVEAPASTDARDGLGPLFNARSCSGCHPDDGRAATRDDGFEGPLVGVLFRLSVEGETHITYGGQLQDQANPGLLPEAVPSVKWSALEGSYDDGSPYELRVPEYSFSNWSHGDPGAFEFSPRLGPQMIGLGLLEAIDAQQILAAEDPDDTDGNGISGRAQWRDTEQGRMLGRFGWKADAPTIAHQVAGALQGDLGLTSSLVQLDDCTATQTECIAEPSGGDPEITETILDRLTVYSRAVAVPVRRDWESDETLRGKGLFHKSGCADCHTPSYTTGAFEPIPEFEGELIWPYTDLLLHDMGDALADGRPLGEASGTEWKTPPLWGLGLLEAVSGTAFYLHDGRARSIDEAILWHGGEGEASANAFKALSVGEREELVHFVETL